MNNLEAIRLLVSLLGSRTGKIVVAVFANWVVWGSLADAVWRAVPQLKRRAAETRFPRLVGLVRILCAGAVVRQVVLAAVWQLGRGQPKWRDDGRPTTTPPPPASPPSP